MEQDEKEIREVMAQEKRRGRARRPVDVDQLRRQQKTLEGIRKALHEKDERAFLMQLRAVGISDEDPRFAELLRLFRGEV